LNGYGKLWNNFFNYSGYFKNNLFDNKGILTNIGNIYYLIHISKT